MGVLAGLLGEWAWQALVNILLVTKNFTHQSRSGGGSGRGCGSGCES